MTISALDNFLTATLGSAGAQALKQLSAIPGAADVVPIRTAVSWVQHGQIGAGHVPGNPDMPLSLIKGGEVYHGQIGSGSNSYVFASASKEHTAAAICAFLGVDGQSQTKVRGNDMVKLAKTIDLLVKAQIKPPHSKAPQAEPAARAQHHTGQPKHEPHDQPNRGMPAAHIEPEEHGAATPKAAARSPKPKQLLKVRIPSSKVDKRCTTCGDKLFEANVFKGCDCIGDLGKSVTTTKIPNALELCFGSEWDREDVFAVLEDINNG